MIKRIFPALCVAVLCVVGAVNAWEIAGGAEARAKRAAAAASDVTYIGCLRVEDDGKRFMLTEVGGKDAPKARSWKTAFITKKAGKLRIVTAEPRLKLRDHVGRTVQITGRRQDKELRARTIKVVGATCE